MNYKVALIGAGQLGSRHLQGLAKSKLGIDIEVVEPFERSRETAKIRFEEMPVNNKIKSIKYFEKISELTKNIDLVIIATNADVRFKVVSELLNEKKVKYLLLEKVLFQRLEEYGKIEKLLEKSNTKCWVNHPRRMYPFYQTLKESLKDAKELNFSISGGNWGLACNGLHFLDLITFLSNIDDLQLNTNFLNKEVKETKRKDYIELSGNLIGKTSNSTFSINSFNSKSPMQFSITSDKLNIFIDESKGWFRIRDNVNEWKELENIEKIIHFQSELSDVLLENIIQTGRCILPTYSESMKLHKVFISSLIDFIDSFSEDKIDYCPIT